MSENKISILRHFGPSIVKIKMPNLMVKILNEYSEKIILDTKKSNELNHGDNLVGNVKQEFRLEEEIMTTSGLMKLLGNTCKTWLTTTEKKDITSFKILSCWIVRQFKNEYNPIHSHGGHISGVGYLKIPKYFGETSQSAKNYNPNGRLTLVHGAKMFNSPSVLDIIPEVGDFYLFPHYMMHSVYPFNNSDEERRSISFNAIIDQEIYNVYGK